MSNSSQPAGGPGHRWAPRLAEATAAAVDFLQTAGDLSKRSLQACALCGNRPPFSDPALLCYGALTALLLVLPAVAHLPESC